jgi:hypothetical protein
MDPTADLGRSLAFVIGRIEEEATRSGEPLSDEERSLLNDLPTDSVVPMRNGSDPESLTVPVPRDTVFERLCALARDARKSDVRGLRAYPILPDFGLCRCCSSMEEK